MSPSNTGRPPALVALAFVVALEAVGAAAVAVLALAASPLGSGVTSGIAVAVFILAIAALLFVVAIGLLRAAAWTRAATLVWQIVQLLVGAYALQGAGASVGFAALAIGTAVLALVLVFTRPVRQALERA